MCDFFKNQKNVNIVTQIMHIDVVKVSVLKSVSLSFLKKWYIYLSKHVQVFSGYFSWVEKDIWKWKINTFVAGLM